MAIRLYFFGQPQVFIDDKEVKLRTAHCLHLLAYLWQNRSEKLSRSVVASVFWPNVSEDKARANLSTCLWSIGKSFPSLILTDAKTISWNHGISVWVDVQEFITELSEKAIQYYRGPFLQDSDLHWSQQVGNKLRAILLGYYAELCHKYKYSNTAQALEWAEQSLKINPLQEEMQRLKMRLLVKQGNRVAALAQYREWEKFLDQEIGAVPSTETRELFKSIFHQPTCVFQEIKEVGAPSNGHSPVVDFAILLKQADGFFDDREWQAARERYYQLTKQTSDPKVLTYLWTQIARCELTLKQIDAALAALKNASCHGYKTGGLEEARIHITRGVISYGQHRWQECISHICKGVMIVGKEPPSLLLDRELATAYNRMGYAYFELGMITDSRQAFIKGIEAAKRANSIPILCLMISGLIKDYLIEGNDKEARKLCDEGMVIVTGVKGVQAYELMAKFANRSAEIYLASENSKLAIQVLRDALKLHETGEIEEEAIILYKNLGIAHQMLGETQNAQDAFDHSLTLAQSRISDHYEEVKSLVDKLRLSQKGGDKHGSAGIRVRGVGRA